ncbi:MAG: hypothetical protein PSU94_16660 [Lacunisphaera sp.]|nr:hypothetical protein [Lacunisphaera sp.]
MARYEAARAARKDASWAARVRRALRLLLALVLFVIGVAEAFLPGPAILFFFFAGGLLAAESRSIARLLDWGEVRLRALWGWGRRHWRVLPVWGKVVCGALAAAVSFGGAYVSYRLVAG